MCRLYLDHGTNKYTVKKVQLYWISFKTDEIIKDESKLNKLNDSISKMENDVQYLIKTLKAAHLSRLLFYFINRLGERRYLAFFIEYAKAYPHRAALLGSESFMGKRGAMVSASHTDVAVVKLSRKLL